MYSKESKFRSQESEPVSQKEIRETFLSFFERKGHLQISYSSLIPQNDPTLLVINSGMAPIKSYFTGAEVPLSKRLCNIQKCIRMNDIENVGNDRHLTFFEMMGNWSIGDYFKEEALTIAWEFLVDVFKFDPSRLSVTIYAGDAILPNVPPDEEAYNIWRALGIPEGRIFRFGVEDNFWGPVGDEGPCGPCSEILYDLGETNGCGKETCGPGCACGRYIEIWNAGVFMQYYMDRNKAITALPFKSVDAGAGLERFAFILQGVNSVHETDLLKPIKDAFLEENNLSQSTDTNFIRSYRIITDHLKGAIFMIGDGIYPANTGREYIVRRLIRRMVVRAHLVGLEQPKVDTSIDTVISNFGKHYPELLQAKELIKRTLNLETTNFSRTLRQARRELDKVLKRTSGSIIAGVDTFRLYDTYGLPLELLIQLASLGGKSVDTEIFNQELEKQRLRSRQASKQ